jgi:glyoxylase-like metal-dependent hydrolase (beta-lactamase superfamily II)
MRPFGFVLFLLASCTSAFAQDFDKIAIRALPVKGNIHLLQAEGGNIAVSVGTDGTLMVDDEYQPMDKKLKAAITALTPQPVRFVINTHWHNDHTGGNEMLGSSGAVIIAHDNGRTRMASDQVMSLYGPQKAYKPEGLPRITFSKSMQLHFNDDSIDIIHLGPAHTDSDVVIFFRGQNILCTGDLFVGPAFRPPYFDDLNGGSTEGMISAIETLVNMANDETIIIPGHGDLASRADLRAYQSQFISIRDRIKKAIAEGRSEEEVVASKPTTGFAIPGKGTDRWVRIVYREYARPSKE